MIWRIASQDREYGKAKKGKNDEEKQEKSSLLMRIRKYLIILEKEKKN